MIYRTDDVDHRTDIGTLAQVHELFLAKEKIQTMSIVCGLIEQNPSVIGYIKNTPNWDLQIHGFVHDNYSQETSRRIESDLVACLDVMDRVFQIKPTRWYLPWNGWVAGHGFDLVPRVAKIAKRYGVEVDYDCIYIGHFLAGQSGDPKFAKDAQKTTVYFHLWDQKDVDLVPRLLEF